MQESFDDSLSSVKIDERDSFVGEMCLVLAKLLVSLIILTGGMHLPSFVP